MARTLSMPRDKALRALRASSLPGPGQKPPFSGNGTHRLWRVIREGLTGSYLMGMDHVLEDVGFANTPALFNLQRIPFEEAIKFFKGRIPLTEAEFYALEAKLRFRAFTVARLAELDAIERVKKLLVEYLEKGLTFPEFWEKGGRDKLLKQAGWHKSNPWYWETVVRTGAQSAYNAGRLHQIKKDAGIEYLEYVGIRDRRQTEICRRRTGAIRPKGDPWWKENWPPLHFNCRSTVRAVYRREIEGQGGHLRVTRPSRTQEIMRRWPPQEYRGGRFGKDPLDSGSFWRITPGMWERAKRYGIKEEIKQLAQELKVGPYRMDDNLDVPRDMKELAERLTELKWRYPAVSWRPVVIEKDPLAISELGAVGLSKGRTAQIWFSSGCYRRLQDILSKGKITNIDEGRAFATMVHEFGHLLGKGVDAFLYENDQGYHYTVEVVNDLWAYFELRKIARDLKIKIKVPVKPILERSGYWQEVERAVKILKAAGFRQDDIKGLVEYLNLSEETTEFIARIEKAMVDKLKIEDLPPSIYRKFGEALHNEKVFKAYLKKTRELARKNRKVRR